MLNQSTNIGAKTVNSQPNPGYDNKFKTGRIMYIFYYSSKKYNDYNFYDSSEYLYFDTNNKKGYLTTFHLGDISVGLGGDIIKKEYSIAEFINQLDIPDSRRYY